MPVRATYLPAGTSLAFSAAAYVLRCVSIDKSDMGVEAVESTALSDTYVFRVPSGLFDPGKWSVDVQIDPNIDPSVSIGISQTLTMTIPQPGKTTPATVTGTGFISKVSETWKQKSIVTAKIEVCWTTTPAYTAAA
jgi:hypothetical protein